jgi:predicted lipoprotein with Yx(FWY)xxD motif
MATQHFNILAWALACALIAAGGAARASQDSGPPVTVQQTEEGAVWATAAGMTLYTSARDRSTPGKSTCNSDRPKTAMSSASEFLPIPAIDKRRTCLQKLMPIYAAADAVPQGPWSLAAGHDGTRVWAYEGQPLYASTKDRRPGDINGLGHFQKGAAGSLRLAFAPLGFPPGMKLVRLRDGLALAVADGRRLYVRRGAQRVCSGCADSLQPVLAPAMGAQPSGDWSIVNGAAGRQYAFKGEPLYAAPPEMDRSEVGRDWTPAIWRRTAGVPADIATHWTVKGDIYAARTGMSLYVFACDAHGTDGQSCDEPGDAAAFWSALCGMDCLERWRPYLAPPGARPMGDWSVVDVAVPLFTEATGLTLLPSEAPARVQAWAYRGRPLFTYFEDEEPGQLLGHAIKYPLAAGFYAVQTPDQDADIE